MLGGSSLGLAGDETEPIIVEPAPPPVEPIPASDQEHPIDPLPGMLGVAGIAAALAALQRRGDDLSPGAGLSLDPGPVVVFIPGHGQSHGSSAFADLIEYMGLDDGSVRHFDYRWVDGGSSASAASEAVLLDDAASALNAYLAGVAGDGREIYLVGFSKGGAMVAELVADWDDGRWGPSDSVVGAALLDPPIARGKLGWLQGVGRFWGPLPDDGGYDPVGCTLLRFNCSDRRVGLGLNSGVDVLVIRNPKAGVTSFGDHPAGLRVYDAADDGPTIWQQLIRNPFALPWRISEAHEAVLHDRNVADCITAELTSGTCDLPKTKPAPRLSSLRRPAIRPPSGQKVL
ncbi:MAG: alpha/beta hydrolase [Acidobacteria bacterium]|nr:alpha/beta hydrolase [Acidobacteriota bacterium]